MVPKDQSTMNSFMTKFQFLRLWRNRNQKFLNYFEWLFLGLSALLFFWHAPLSILNTEPATGGDTGSHFWPLVTLVKQGLPSFSVRVWNPGNLGGEPHLTHYFPLPYLLMALLSIFIPLGQAFNLGTILPVFAYPFCIYYGLKKAKLASPAPVLGALISLLFLYNESFSMWGGNALSTLAGQFAHLYAFCFFSLGLGFLFSGLEKRKFSLAATVCFAATLISHFYVALFVPIVFAGCLIRDHERRWQNFKLLLTTGLISLLLSAWFVIPMLHNAAWTTPFGLKWVSANIFLEAFPVNTWPALLLIFASLAFIFLRWKKSSLNHQAVFIWPSLLLLSLSCILFYFIFPVFGLVDIRIFPMLYFAIAWLLPSLLTEWLKQLTAKPIRYFSYFIFAALCFWWSAHQIRNFPGWMKWNYSSWSAKTSYKDLQALSSNLKGDFSQGRVLYENSELSNSAGTMRVFEMLPYFAGRATWESVYMQATVLAPAAFYMQALISKTPSCPFPNFSCTGFDPAQMDKYSRLMAISDYILINDEVMVKADQTSFMQKQNQYGLWHWYKNKQEVSLVDIPVDSPELVPKKDFKNLFFNWFINYHGDDRYLIVDEKASFNPQAMINSGKVNCDAKVKVDFNTIELSTLCPGKLHALKFAYHPSFQASNGEELYLLSPGFIGIVPKQTQVKLEWGHHWLWSLSNALSWLTAIALLVFSIRKGRT